MKGGVWGTFKTQDPEHLQKKIKNCDEMLVLYICTRTCTRTRNHTGCNSDLFLIKKKKMQVLHCHITVAIATNTHAFLYYCLGLVDCIDVLSFIDISSVFEI